MRNVLIFTLAFFIVLVCINNPLRAGNDMEKMKQQLEKINTEFAKANVDGDLEKMYSYYTDDAVFMPNYGPMVKGRTTMMQQEKEMRDKGFKVYSFNLKTLDLWGCDNLYYEVGTYSISLTLPGMDVPVADNGKYFSVWRKDSDGSLKMKYDIWNTDMNPWQMGEKMDEQEEMNNDKDDQ